MYILLLRRACHRWVSDICNYLERLARLQCMELGMRHELKLLLECVGGTGGGGGLSVCSIASLHQSCISHVIVRYVICCALQCRNGDSLLSIDFLFFSFFWGGWAMFRPFFSFFCYELIHLSSACCLGAAFVLFCKRLCLGALGGPLVSTDLRSEAAESLEFPSLLVFVLVV